jgi:hypothetical protein
MRFAGGKKIRPCTAFIVSLDSCAYPIGNAVEKGWGNALAHTLSKQVNICIYTTYIKITVTLLQDQHQEHLSRSLAKKRRL